MEERLITRLHSYIIQNNPELLLSLQGGGRIGNYLEQKVATIGPLIDGLIEAGAAPYFIEEECLAILTQDLRPSKYHYVSHLLQQDLPTIHRTLQESGSLTFVISEIIALSINLFDTIGFSGDKEDNEALDTALESVMCRYFGEK